MCKVNTSRLLIKLIFDERPTRQMSVAQGLFRWVRAQGRGPDTPNGSGLVDIPLKWDALGARR